MWAVLFFKDDAFAIISTGTLAHCSKIMRDYSEVEVINPHRPHPVNGYFIMIIPYKEIDRARR